MLHGCARGLDLRSQSKSSTKTDEKFEAIFYQQFISDLRYWVEQDRRVALKALELIEAVIKEPFSGIGKPEPLKHALADCWSRRLTQEHRIIYLVRENQVHFIQARYHY